MSKSINDLYNVTEWLASESRALSAIGISRSAFVGEFWRTRQTVLAGQAFDKARVMALGHQMYQVVWNIGWVNLFAWMLPRALPGRDDLRQAGEVPNYTYVRSRVEVGIGVYIGYRNGLNLNADVCDKDEWTVDAIRQRTDRMIGQTTPPCHLLTSICLQEFGACGSNRDVTASEGSV